MRQNANQGSKDMDFCLVFNDSDSRQGKRQN